MPIMSSKAGWRKEKLANYFLCFHLPILLFQALLERVRREKKYERNITWEGDYQLLRCQAQPFYTKITLNGEFYDLAR